MTVEINAETAWTLVFFFIVCGIASVSMWGCHQSEETTREKIRAGLVQKEIPNTYTTIWAKPE